MAPMMTAVEFDVESDRRDQDGKKQHPQIGAANGYATADGFVDHLGLVLIVTEMKEAVQGDNVFIHDLYSVVSAGENNEHPELPRGTTMLDGCLTDFVGGHNSKWPPPDQLMAMMNSSVI